MHRRTDYSHSTVNLRRPPPFRHRESPEPPDNRPANFIVELWARDHGGDGGSRKAAVVALIKQCCVIPPDGSYVPVSGMFAGRIFFTQWNSALEAVVALWRTRLSGEHDFTPKLIPNVFVPSDVDELNSRLKPLFSEKISCLKCGEAVERWKTKANELDTEIDRLNNVLRRNLNFDKPYDLRKKLLVEKKMILKRIDEFECALDCILGYIEDDEEDLLHDWASIPVFKLKGEVNWARVYGMISRECRRLDDGLPIYAVRREILQLVNSNQIMVLIGETGSGKSTQIVQFLADSGLVADGSIICTQPRKIAAISLDRRVQEESHGCYDDNYVKCVPYYSSALQFKSNVIFMTDHCLLQHCMSDRNLKGVSCILVDEAHERSLNTDLLLALLKWLLPYRPDLRLIIMSATADAKQLSNYFFSCRMFWVMGRKFNVEVKYVPPCAGMSQPATKSADAVPPYVYSTLETVTDIHKKEQDGTILAFLTSPLEVEWACERFHERFHASNAEPLALHGKLSHEEQSRVFQNYPGKRKIIFTTNVAETSLTIPGVKFVVDSGMMKESRFDTGSGMNVLKVCWVSKSSAIQRAGRAGRTDKGCCYRLYSEDDFHSMSPQQEPEIRRVHLGVAVLKIVALGVKNVKEFDFIDSPSPGAIDMAVQNLIQLGAVTVNNGELELTEDGRYLVKLGIEPRLGKLILSCCSMKLEKEGLVLAALMANSSNIFCRVGNQSDKLKSDSLKVNFSHDDGDLFTLLSVFKEWECMPPEKRNTWCWNNHINAKSMRRCHDTISELENCLKTELHIVVPSYWKWVHTDRESQYHKDLQKAVLASLAENVAMFSGCGKLGYKVALSGQYIDLHPLCSLKLVNRNPDWVVFGEILSASNQYLMCVTAFDGGSLSTLTPAPLFDPCEIEKQKLQLTAISGLGKTTLKKFCGKLSNGLLCLVSKIKGVLGDDRIRIEVDIDSNTIQLFSSACDVEKVSKLVQDALDCERRWLSNECVERCLYYGSPGVLPPVALFGAGAEIKHLEVDKRCLTVDVFHSNVRGIDDKELVMFIESRAPGICSVHKSGSHVWDTEDPEKWGSITFLSPDAAIKAAELNNVEFDGCKLRINLSRATYGINRALSFPAVRAKLFWPRRLSKGVGILLCNTHDVEFLVQDLSNLLIGKRYIRCEAGKRSPDSVVISGIDRLASETEIIHALRSATARRILDFFLVRENIAVDNPPCHVCEEALFRELSSFMPKGNPQNNLCRVCVLPPDPKHAFAKALVTFDGRLHLEAAKALEQIQGTTLPGFQPWQKIECQQLFHTSVSCPSSVYAVIKNELDSMLARFNRLRGTECTITKNANGSIWVKISATATKTVAELRKPLEELMKGRAISHASLTPDVLQLLFTRDGISLMRSLERELGASILFDRRRLEVRIFAPSEKAVTSELRFVESLVNLHEMQHEIHLRGVGLPNGLMKEVVRRFGHDLHTLKEMVPYAEFTLNIRRHVISICGSKEAKQKVEELINEIAQASGQCLKPNDGGTCPICFCPVEDKYLLESCSHVFCRSCLVDQCESSIRNKDGFPLRCFHEGCNVPIWLADLKSLLTSNKLDELFESSMVAFVTSSCGAYRFCPSPDCPSVYKVADPHNPTEPRPFLCGACYAETCTSCHLEWHPNLSCEKFKEYKDDPDASLKEWLKGKEEFVKKCPGCGYTIEKAEGCNHVECKCGRHLCWVCLQHFFSSEDCYSHLRTIHQGIS